MQLKAELEMDDAAFAAREHDMSRTKQELMLALPMFASGAVPFQWMYAADYFMCRRAHDIAMLLGSETHANATVQHLGYRFRQVRARCSAVRVSVANCLFCSMSSSTRTVGSCTLLQVD